MNSRLAAKFLHSNIHHSNCKYTHNHEIKWQEDSWHEQPTCICTQNWASQTLPLNWWTQNTTSEPTKFILSLSRSLSLRYVKKKCQTKHPKGTTSSSLDTSFVLFCFRSVLVEMLGTLGNVWGWWEREALQEECECEDDGFRREQGRHSPAAEASAMAANCAATESKPNRNKHY